MTDTPSGSSADRVEPRHRPDRVALWAALLVLHAGLLVACYSWVVMDGSWNDGAARAFAICAFVGLFATIGNATSSLAHANETGIIWRGRGSRPNITKARALLWVTLEITSLAMLSFCAAILVYRVLNAG